MQSFRSSHGAVLIAWTQPNAGLQLSSVHALASSHVIGVPARHPVSGLQVSNPLHGFASSQFEAVPWQAPPLQARSLIVHGLPSSQALPAIGVPRHAPRKQASPTVHVSVSLQAAPSGRAVKLQPIRGSHEPAEHESPGH